MKHLKAAALLAPMFIVHPNFALGTTSESCTVQRSFIIEGKSIQLCWADATEAWVSFECVASGKEVCGAIKLAASAKHRDVELGAISLSGGKNPGSVLCSKLGGTVMLATLTSGSQLSFCQAKDNTLIDCNALANQFQANR